LFDLLVDLNEYLNVGGIHRLIVVEQRLKLKETQFLDAFRGVNGEAAENDLNRKVKVLFNNVFVSCRARPTRALRSTHAPLDTALDVLLLREKVTLVSEAAEHDCREHEALRLDLPVLVALAQLQHLLGDVHDRLRVLLGDAVQDVQGVDAHVGLRVGKADQRVVKEHVEPLLVEFLLLSDQVGLARVHDLVVGDVVLEVLHDLDALVEVVARVAVDQLADVLPLVRALLHDLAVVLEQVVYEEPVELLLRALLVLVDLLRERLAEDQGVHEAA